MVFVSSFVRVCALLLALALVLIGCSSRTIAQHSTVDTWSLAVIERDYATAQRLMVKDDVAAWQAMTQQFDQEHHATGSYQRSDIPMPPGQPPIIHTRWTWKDGFVRCLKVQETAEGLIDVLDPGYHVCADEQPEVPD